MLDVFVCKGSRLAIHLIKNGCKCFKTDIDDENPNYLVHLFEKDENFKLAMDKWYK